MEPLTPRLPQLVAAGTVEVRGRIRLPNGMALPGAIVQPVGASGAATTGPDGSFSLLVPTPATNDHSLVLNVLAPGYAQQQVAIMLAADAPEPLDIYLQALLPKEPMHMLLGGISAVSVRVQQRQPGFWATDLWEAVRQATSRNP